MAIGECKSTLISFAIYILVIAASATIMMFVERAGLKATALNGGQQRPANVTKSKLNLTYHIKTHINKHGSQKWEDSDVENLLAEITRFKVTVAGREQDWRRTVSWKTFSTWEYYVVVTVSTIGMFYNELIYLKREVSSLYTIRECRQKPKNVTNCKKI